MTIQHEAPQAGERRAALESERKTSRRAVRTSPDKKKKERPVPQRVQKRERIIKKRTKVDWLFVWLAEAFIFIGIVGSLFFVWKFVLNDMWASNEQNSAAESVMEEFSAGIAIESIEYDPLDPPIGVAPRNGETIGVISIPKLGIMRVIAEGTTRNVLDNRNTGVGHYTGSQMPGDYGNFALAGHRNSTFPNLKALVPGDYIYIQTELGYYTYVIKQDRYIVKPSAIEVVSPIPGDLGSSYERAIMNGNKTLTLTTCWPEWSNTERLIVHAEFVEWRPLEAGKPAGMG